MPRKVVPSAGLRKHHSNEIHTLFQTREGEVRALLGPIYQLDLHRVSNF